MAKKVKQFPKPPPKPDPVAKVVKEQVDASESAALHKKLAGLRAAREQSCSMDIQEALKKHKCVIRLRAAVALNEDGTIRVEPGFHVEADPRQV